MSVEKFVEQSTVTGLREAYTTKSWPLKIFWLICILTGITLTCYFILKVLEEYNETKTATKVIYNQQDIYDIPPISICPPYWIDTKKIDNTGLSVGAINYAFSFLSGVISKRQCKDIASTDKAEFQRYMKRNNIEDILNFYHKVSYDVGDIVISCPGCSNVTDESWKHFTETGMCYALKLSPYQNNLITFDKTRVIAVNNMNGVNLVSRFQSFTNSYRIIIDPDRRSIIRSKEYVIQVDVDNTVYVSYVIKEFLNEPSRPCLSAPTSDYSQQHCMVVCLQDDDIYVNLCNKSCYFLGTFDGVNNDNDTRPLCRQCLWPPDLVDDYDDVISNHTAPRLIRVGDDMDDDDDVDEDQCYHHANVTAYHCSRKCPPPCVQVSYQVTTVKYKKWFESTGDGNKKIDGESEHGKHEYTMIFVIFEIGLNGIEIQKEYTTYSMETLISNVGGVLGLWVGASAMTLVQIFVFFAQTAVDLIRRRILLQSKKDQKERNKPPAVQTYENPNGEIQNGATKSAKRLNRFY